MAKTGRPPKKVQCYICHEYKTASDFTMLKSIRTKSPWCHECGCKTSVKIKKAIICQLALKTYPTRPNLKHSSMKASSISELSQERNSSNPLWSIKWLTEETSLQSESQIPHSQ